MINIKDSQKDIYNKAIKDATLFESLISLYWDFFVPKKRLALHKYILYGYSWKDAYNKAKKV